MAVLAFALNTIAQDYNLSITHDGKTRTFILHSPCGTFDCSGKKIPLVFAFHGFTETATAIKNYSDFDKVADTAGFAVVYANGLQNRWNVGYQTTAASEEDDLGFVNAMIDYMITNASRCDSNICAEIDTSRIYACGMSNGGFFSYHLACNLSRRIAAVASVTGSMTPATFDTCFPTRPIAVFELHGTSDNIVPYNGGGQSSSKSVSDVLDFWVNHNGCTGSSVQTNLPDVNTNDGCTVESYQWSNCANATEVLHYKIVGGGHTWPAMTNNLPEILVGKTNRDVHGSEEIWRFFNRHFLDHTATAIDEKFSTHAFKLYPNPANDVLIADATHEASLKVFDVNGRSVMQLALEQGANHIVANQLARGFYIARFESKGAVSFLRFVKE